MGGRGGRAELAAPPRALADPRRVRSRPCGGAWTSIPTGYGSPTWTSRPAASPFVASSATRAGSQAATCQAEQEDRYRPDPGGGLALAGRQVFNGWHRELQRSATRFFAALAAGNGKTLAELVPDAALRARLPRGLAPEAACDSQNPDTSGTAIVAAAVPLPSGARSPWSLWWGRSPSGWRLTGAAPVLE